MMERQDHPPLRYPWLRHLGSIKSQHVLILFGAFMAATIWLSNRIMTSEIENATSRLLSSSANASRNLESRFDALRDDFRLLVSIHAFDAYVSGGPQRPGDSRDVALVKRFFARHQESISHITLLLKDNKQIIIRILPGNYLTSERQPNTSPARTTGKPSDVVHDGTNLILHEQLPPGDASRVQRASLVLDHNSFFKGELATYLMGQSDLWIWSLDDHSGPALVRDPLVSERRGLRVEATALQAIRRNLDDGLEGIHEHNLFTPEAHPVISVFSPLMLGEEPMGLVFSTARATHLRSLNRLSAFLGLTFGGVLLLLGAWFGISYLRIRQSEQLAIEARKRAESADRAKGRFVAAMSHEIRTPLNGVLGYAELLRQSGLSPTQSDYLEVIRNSGDHLLSVLNDILDFSRIEAGAQELRRQAFSPAMVAEDILEMLSTAAEANGLELHLNVAPGVPENVVGDIGRIRQILFNLVGNGIKFTNHGSVGITILADELPRNWRLQFTITDTGIGIPKENLHQLFKPFSQVDHPDGRRHEGTGLGLAICKRLVETMEGEIEVTSRPGGGSSFQFFVTVGKAAGGTSSGFSRSKTPRPPSASCSAATATRAADEPEPGGGPSILVVEDNRINSALLTALLRKRGCRTTLAENGTAALETVDRETFDLILMDIEMPGMDGIQTTRLIRARERQKVIPLQTIIGVSAHAFLDHREAALEAGMDDYITKPVDPAELDRILRSLARAA